jgi:hypothetical protein
MVQLPSDTSDNLLIAAILQSDDVVHILQRKLRLIYPSLHFSKAQILDLLRRDIIREGLLDESKLKSATDLLAQAKAAAFEIRATRSTGTFKAVPSKDAEEDVHDMWHDKTMASGGG